MTKTKTTKTAAKEAVKKVRALAVKAENLQAAIEEALGKLEARAARMADRLSDAEDMLTEYDLPDAVGRAIGRQASGLYKTSQVVEEARDEAMAGYNRAVRDE